MYRFNNHVPDYDIPLKEELPWLPYDIAIYCDNLLRIIDMPFPEYLNDYYHVLVNHACKLKKMKCPAPIDSYRVYIIDYRLNVLFATLDSTGIIATYFSKYGKHGHMIEDYYYGDGSFIPGHILPGQPYDKQEMGEFSSEFGFLPMEEFSMSAAIVFSYNEMVERRPLSQFQTSLLMEKFHSKNLIDWKSIVKYTDCDFSLR